MLHIRSGIFKRCFIKNEKRRDKLHPKNFVIWDAEQEYAKNLMQAVGSHRSSGGIFTAETSPHPAAGGRLPARTEAADER